MDISKYALTNKPLVITSLIVLVVGGWLAYRSMSKLEDPELKVKTAVVAVIYPGASAHQVELEVAIPLEKAIRAMGSVNNIESRSTNDLCLTTVELLSTVPDDEVQQTWDMLRRKVGDLALPATAVPQVMDDYGDVYGMFYAVTSDGYDDRTMSKYVELVSRELIDIEGISKTITYGERDECINIELSQERMANLGVHPGEIMLTLNTQNSKVYSGYFESGEKRLRLEVGDYYTDIEDIRNLLIKGHEQDMLRLCDVADIEFGFEEPVRNLMKYDGKKAIGLLVSAESGTDITKIGDQVDANLKYLKENIIPTGIDFHQVFFQPDIVKESMSTFIINLIESVLIVIFILMLTMGLRSGMIIGVSLVVIVFGSFLVLNMFDGTLQRVSLGSFILAMGMLVDNAIVIIDGILVDMKRGVPKPECLTNIGKKTAIPLLGATIIAILAFLPIMMSPDMAGTYVRDLFIVLAVSLLLSWILALTHVPIHAGFSLKAPKQIEGAKEEDASEMFTSKPYQKLRGVLDFVLKNRGLTVCFAIVLVLASAWCYRYMPQMFFPDMSYDQLYVEYRMQEGTTSARVEADLAQMEAFLKENDDNIEHITTSIGGTPGRYCLVRAIAQPSMSYGELIVKFKDRKKMVKDIPQMQRDLMTRFPEAFVRVKQYNLMYRPFPIEVEFSGPDPGVLKDLCAQAQAVMEKSDATWLISSNWDPLAPTLVIDYDQPTARNTGISRADAGVSVMAAAGGIPCGTYTDGDERLNIYIKSTDSDGNPVESLDNAPVWSLNPSQLSNLSMETVKGVLMGMVSEEEILSTAIGSVPLNQVASGISVRWDEQIVCRRNCERSIKAQCNNTENYTAAEARMKILKDIEAIQLPDGYEMEWLGEYEASKQSSRYLFANVPLSIVLMILILIALFKDIKKPAIIFCCLPLIAIGVVFGMLASGKEFGFVAIVGTLGIIGMMIKNGIVLMDEIGRQIGLGIEPYKAVVDSTMSRFRPVMMASMTTVVGMIPLLWDPLFGSLAVTIMGGLTVGTLITLLFLPVLYSLFFNIRKK